MTHLPMRHRQSSAVAVAAVLSVLSCAAPTDVIGGRLVVGVAPPVLHLTNRSPAPVYFFAIEGGLAMRANWGPCTDPAHCRGIAAGGSFALPLDDVAGYHAEAKTLLVYWWHLIPGGPTGFHPDSIRVAGAQL